MMDSMINDYRSEKFNQLNSVNAATLALYSGASMAEKTGRTESDERGDYTEN